MRLTFATMRWKVMSSSSIFSFPFPHFLSVTLNQIHIFNKFKKTKSKKQNNYEREIKNNTFRVGEIGVFADLSSCHLSHSLALSLCTYVCLIEDSRRTRQSELESRVWGFLRFGYQWVPFVLLITTPIPIYRRHLHFSRPGPIHTHSVSCGLGLQTMGHLHTPRLYRK